MGIPGSLGGRGTIVDRTQPGQQAGRAWKVVNLAWDGRPAAWGPDQTCDLAPSWQAAPLGWPEARCCITDRLSHPASPGAEHEQASR